MSLSMSQDIVREILFVIWLARSISSKRISPTLFFIFVVYQENENVYHGQEGSRENLFLAYMCFFSELNVHLPFDVFITGMLHELKFSPLQLHLNS